MACEVCQEITGPSSRYDDLCRRCEHAAIVWAAKEARRDRIMEQAVADYAKASVYVGLNGNANEDEPLISEHTGCKVQGPVVDPNVLGSNVVLGDGCTMVEPEAMAANATNETYSNPFFTRHRNEW